jgi:hypothetical protein
VKRGQADGNQVIWVLRQLKQEQKVDTRELENRLLMDEALQVAGAVGEIWVLAKIMIERPDLQIIELGLNLKDQTKKDLELFDIICRDTKTNKLIFIEVKRTNHYTLGDFLHQFFGIGGKDRKYLQKETCQADALCSPEKFSGWRKLDYQAAVARGDYQIWVVTTHRVPSYDLERLYFDPEISGPRLKTQHLLRSISSGAIQFCPPEKTIFAGTPEAVKKMCGEISQNLISSKAPLANVSVTFMTLADL